MFDMNQPYVTLQEPGDTGRKLMVQGSIALWEGWPPTDSFPTPGWAQRPSDTAQDPVDFQKRTEEAANKVTRIKGRLEEVEKDIPRGEPLKRKT
jgi:hypothetical protein